MNALTRLYADSIRKLDDSQWVALLIARVAIGFFFVMSGYNKLFVHGIGDGFTEYGIPFPVFNGWLNAIVQLVGGSALIVGFGTRIWSVVVGFAMVVASVTATIPTVLTQDLPGAESHLLFWGWFYYHAEPIYLTVFLLLLFVGPGKASVDHLIARRARSKRTT
jgi:putative oxidoreductase